MTETIEYRDVFDKSTWGPGEWQDEPDKKQWQDEATGLPCLIVRNGEGSGALCGYVGVPREHFYHGKDYNEPDVDVHGGLTFADACGHSEIGPQRGICHIPGDGEPDDVWWFGFDCAHAWDIRPASEARDRERGWDPLREPSASYRYWGYVEREVARLASQLAALKDGPPHERGTEGK